MTELTIYLTKHVL